MRNHLRVYSIAAILAFGPGISDAAPATQPTSQPAATTPRLSLEEFDKARQQKEVVLLDVRSAEEYAGGHVPGSVNVPVTGKGAEGFEKTVGEIDKGRSVIVYCRSGVRSAKAAEKLKTMGFSHLADFHGGWVAWKEAGKPTENGANKE